MVHSEIEQKGHYFSCNSCTHIWIGSHIINIPHQNNTFIKIDEPTLTHYNHSKSIVSISWCWSSYRIRKLWVFFFFNATLSIFLLLVLLIPKPLKTHCSILFFHWNLTKNACFVFYYNYPRRYEVASHIVLICVSLKANDVEHLFHLFISYFYHLFISFGKMSSQVLCSFWNSLSLCCWVAQVLYIFYIYLIRYMIWKHFISFSELSFTFLRVSLNTKYFNFDIGHLIYLSFIGCTFGFIPRKHYPIKGCKNFPLIYLLNVLWF